MGSLLDFWAVVLYICSRLNSIYLFLIDCYQLFDLGSPGLLVNLDSSFIGDWLASVRERFSASPFAFYTREATRAAQPPILCLSLFFREGTQLLFCNFMFYMSELPRSSLDFPVNEPNEEHILGNTFVQSSCGLLILFRPSHSSFTRV